ncbi:mitochondrial K+-H+ exchange-related-domain-containing protein [Crassisporium funariophilum]|nr:mitochondrial K+-H+ exchange-related-domain-containing protein [Crassisporium funariophilum]
MSSALPGLRKMRIIAIPLTRPVARAVLPSDAKRSRLTYYQFKIAAPRIKPPPPTAESGGVEIDAKTEKKGWLPEEGVANWVTNKASHTWAGFGKAEGGWKLKTYQFGERLVDRMDFEELALKSIDPSMGPSITQFKRTPVLEEKREPMTIPLVFPPSLLSSSEVLSELRAYTEHRIPRHRRGFYFWMIVAPFTAPFMIIPIVPNLPFFFCVWRSWSHYRAYRSSQYLQSLLEHDVIVPEASEPLNEVYKLHPFTPSPSASTSTPPGSAESSIPKPQQEPQHEVLLGRDAVPAILSTFELGSTAAADLYRAVEQARVRVSSGRSEL